jgi:hypothetical protein
VVAMLRYSYDGVPFERGERRWWLCVRLNVGAGKFLDWKLYDNDALRFKLIFCGAS